MSEPTYEYGMPVMPVSVEAQPAPTKRRTWPWLVFAAVLIAGVVAGALMLVSMSHKSTHGIGAIQDTFLTDVTSLEDSIQETFNADADTDYNGVTVTDVGCIAQEHRMFLCHLDWSDNDGTTIDVQVNAAGDDWISSSHR